RGAGPARVALKLAGLLTPLALLGTALVLLKSPVFTQPSVVEGAEAPPLVVRQEKEVAALERIANAEGTNQFIRLDQIAELTDENDNEIDQETLNPYRVPEREDARSPAETGKAFFTHRVKGGDTVWSIARKYRVNVDGVVTLNRLSQASRLAAGEILKIPRLPGVFHEVRKNETVDGIARLYQVDAEEIRTYNAIGPYLAVGTVLFLYKARLPASMRAGSFGVQFAMPVRGFLTSPYGMRLHPIMHTPLFHSGIDVGANQGERVVAAEEGTVTFAGESGWAGNTIIIRHASGYESLYGHLSRFLCAPGRRVKKGDPIGEVGSTGMSTGPHLHFEIRFRGQFLNPLRFVTPNAAAGVASSGK
ncbi:MAG: peptidoglycan DD-metalloendopeptidase family protein, partial [Spirochaetes bacterium]|nr:peptidoglycan DD-metalloendopeptidase family protein [Spirochaetota bacterium]